MLPALVLAAALACAPIKPQDIVIIYYNPPHNCTPIATQCQPGEQMLFNAVGGYNFGCGPHSFAWRFSDGTLKTGKTISHTFLEHGVHSVELTVANPASTAKMTRIISMGIRAFSISATETAPQTFIFQAQRAIEADYGEWTWTLGDGTVITTREPVLTHRYTKAGKYVVTLAAANAVGAQATEVRVDAVAPSRRRSSTK